MIKCNSLNDYKYLYHYKKIDDILYVESGDESENESDDSISNNPPKKAICSYCSVSYTKSFLIKIHLVTD